MATGEAVMKGEEWMERRRGVVGVSRGFSHGETKINSRTKIGLFFSFLFALWERKTRVRPSQPYYKTTEEEGDVHRQRSFMEAGQAPGFL